MLQKASHDIHKIELFVGQAAVVFRTYTQGLGSEIFKSDGNKIVPDEWNFIGLTVSNTDSRSRATFFVNEQYGASFNIDEDDTAFTGRVR